MDKIKRCIEMTFDAPCNLSCSYCYIPMRRDTNNIRQMRILQKYDAEYIGRALSRERLGGSCFINITAEGETLIPKDFPDIVKALLSQGHYVAITTNGTLSEKFDLFMEFPKEYLSHLQFTFSLHWIELKQKNLIDTFFDNVNKVKNAGCSFSIRIGISDEYLPYLEDIKSVCIEKTGALPHALPVVDFSDQTKLKRYTSLNLEEYKKVGDSFSSVQFAFKNSILFVKQKKFCYAGDWFFHMNLTTGMICPCYAEEYTQNIYDNISDHIRFKAIGKNCKSPYCEGCCFILPFGLIPGLHTPTAAQMFERQEASSHTNEMRTFMSGKLYDNNKEYTRIQKLITNLPYYKTKIERYCKTSVFKKPEVRLKLTAMNEENPHAMGNEIVVKKIIVDKTEYSPSELFEKGWKHYEKGYLGWNCYTEGLCTSVWANIPKGHFRAVVFQKNRWRGFVSILTPQEHFVIDCYEDMNDGELLFTF